MLYTKNSYHLWQDLIHKTKGNYQLSEKHIGKWIGELEQCMGNEYRLLGSSYLVEMTRRALGDKTKKIPYALYETFRFILTEAEKEENVSLSKRVFVDPRFVCLEEESRELEWMIKRLCSLYGRKRQENVICGHMNLISDQEWNKIRQEKQQLVSLKKEIEQMKETAVDQIRKSAAYQLRMEEEERYLNVVAEDIERRERFEEQLCNTLHGVSGSFHGSVKSLTEQLVENMNQLVEIMQEETGRVVDEMKKNTANAINQVVDIERSLRKDDFEPLLRNFGELQEMMYYEDIPDEVLGMERSKIGQYSRRFLKVLNRLGYEAYLPEPGEEYDTCYHVAEEEPEKRERYEVADVISCGFRKGEEICLPAKVTLRKGEE